MSEFKSCPVCQEQSDQCLSCASYVVDGERIYYKKLKDFGATKDHEVRFINRIQKQSTTAFFHNGKLHIPSRQGRSVPLAIGLQWDAWQEQQAKVDELQRRNKMLSNNIKEQGQKLVYQNEVIETQAEKLLGLRDEKAGLQKQVGDLIYKAKLREFDHRALLVKYQVTKKCWEDVGGKCEELKAQLNNMEVCYIEKKKQVEAVDAVLMNWRDEYTEFAHQHECTVDAVLRTCIAELEQAMRGAND